MLGRQVEVRRGGGGWWVVAVYRLEVPFTYGLRSGIVFQRIRKRKATSFGVCSELCDGGRGSYMKGQLGEGSFAAVSAARKNLQLLPFHL